LLYSTVVIDPPWRYNSPGWLGGTDRHYQTLPTEAFVALPIDTVAAEDAHLWMWTTDSHLENAFELIKAWGFERRATFPWIKLSPKRIKAGTFVEDANLVLYENGVHKLQYGNGYYGRSVAEFLILATRGKNIVVQEGRHVRKVILAPVGQHSEKPRAAYAIISDMSPGPYIDLFGRTRRAGFDSWGLEAEHCVHHGNLNIWSKWAEVQFQSTNNAKLTNGEGDK
jgi:N6-adenosine-specific RNA methylase IME4